MEDWRTPITNFKRASQVTSQATLVSGMSEMSVAQPSDIYLPANASLEAKLLYTQLLALGRAVAHWDIANAHHVHANLEFVGFTIFWYSRPAWGDLKDAMSISRVMDAYGLVPTSREFYNRFGPQLGKEFFGNVKLIYQIAACISPITLFIPKNLSARKLRRDHLLHVCR